MEEAEVGPLAQKVLFGMVVVVYTVFEVFDKGQLPLELMCAKGCQYTLKTVKRMMKTTLKKKSSSTELTLEKIMGLAREEKMTKLEERE